MKLHTKALYNLLRLNRTEDPAAPFESWQTEDLRLVSLEELFSRLRKEDLVLNKESFLSFAQECDSPEDLAELLLEEHAYPKQHDRIYLVIFELWRRLFPERQSLSIFCDEFDHRIALYDADQLESDEPIQDALANLKEILDESADEGGEPPEVFEAIGSYCAHDVVSFLIDTISDLLDNGNHLYAADLIEDFSPYISEPVWFDFLRARVTAVSDPVEANRQIARILEQGQLLDVDLLLEMLRFQTTYGERPLFIAIAEKIVSHLSREEEFRDLMEIAADYFRRRDRDDLEQAVQRLLENRAEMSGPLDPLDPDVKIFEKIIPAH